MAAAQPAAAPPTESVHEALCRVIENAARQHGVPPEFLTNLIWRESSFREGAVSRAGAQGIAQFMPYTAAERGLADPFDPEQAIPQAARLIADLAARFGNLGLAAAAYNAGAVRVEKWLASEGGLPAETRNFVVLVTGRAADDWAAMARGDPGTGHACLSLHRSGGPARPPPAAEGKRWRKRRSRHGAFSSPATSPRSARSPPSCGRASIMPPSSATPGPW
jgi:hypothetical protein